MKLIEKIKQVWTGLPLIEKYGITYLASMNNNAMTLAKQFGEDLMLDCGNLAVNLPVEDVEVIESNGSTTLKIGKVEVTIRG